MQYKALMSDIDGTLIPYQWDALPSERVVAAIQKAQEKLAVCLVTGRAYASVENVLQHLGITSGYAVLDNGAHVLDLTTKEILYDQPLDQKDTDAICTILHEEGVAFFAKRALFDNPYLDAPIKKGEKVQNASMLFAWEEYTAAQMERIEKALSAFPHVNMHRTHHKDAEKYGLNITHTSATKAHGVEVVIKKMGVRKEEIIAVGDSYNDFPLLMASGFKVAMGNAVDDLKTIADYVTAPVTEDGVAELIEKFILTS